MKFARGYAAIVWFEELDQFDGIDAVRSILNSLRRGGDDFWIFYSYNPPRTLWSWVNREGLERERRADTLVRQSSYLDVIESHPEWLGAPFVEEAEYLRSVDERAWRSEYLGEVTGTGGSVFNNVVSVRLSDAACRGFSRTRCGVDWGWFPDPWRFVRMGWEPGERRLTIFGELSANRKTPAETAALVTDALTYADAPGEDAYLHDELIWCDDTPDGKQSMAVWRREAGLRVRQRPQHRCGALRDDGRRAEGLGLRAFFSSYFDTQRLASAVAALGRLLMGDPRAPRGRPRDATSSPRRAASRGARQACCPAWPSPGRAPSAP